MNMVMEKKQNDNLNGKMTRLGELFLGWNFLNLM